MTAATTKTTALTNRLAGIKKPARHEKGQVVRGRDTHTFATTEIDDVADIVLLNITVPSNALHWGCWIYNADLDTNATPTLVLDMGLYAAEAFTSTASGTATKNAQFAALDVDALVDGSTAGQAATTNFTALAPPSATFAPADGSQAYWEILGYDFDPKTSFLIGVTNSAVSATPAAVAATFVVEYTTD